MFLSLLIPTKLTITKIHQLISSRFEQSEHKKSQCGAVDQLSKIYNFLGHEIFEWLNSKTYLLSRAVIPKNMGIEQT